MRAPSLFLIFLQIILVLSAPSKSKDRVLPQTVYDQKQTGDYNIQLHLKDFQIIALLSDEALSGLGDYDYNYDYSDFTIKPPGNITQKPSSTETSPTSSTTLKSPSSSITSEISTTVKTTTKAEQDATTPLSPDKIKVHIIQDPETPSLPPSEEIETLNHDSPPPLGEILHYRRCATGFARDKKGRCRRVRRPGAPFDISRLASNLAERFRQTPAKSLSTSSESTSAGN